MLQQFHHKAPARMISTLNRPDGHTISYEHDTGRGPTIVFLHGFASDRGGTKAAALAAHCRTQGLACLRFDMFGHGASSGRFQDGGPTRWTEDALAVLDQLTDGPVVLVGSSMGGWVALKTALMRPGKVAGLIGIAPAPDFTAYLIWDHLSPVQRQALANDGHIELPHDYSDTPLRISRHLIEDGRSNLMLLAPIGVTCPVRLLQGQCDTSVPWRTALTISERLTSHDVIVTLIKDGDHRLSRPEDLQLLCRAIDDMVAKVRS